MQARSQAAAVPLIVAAVLTSVYVATLAPGVTLWDAGEFLAAAHSLGIPHPPGTPLYVVLASVWGKAVGSLLGFARAINLLSALATAAGCAVLGWCVARWSTSRIAGIAAGIAAGSMLSVWRSATETEVYALSFALALSSLALADRAGASGRLRDAVLALYVLALAIPLHLSALVLAPGVVLFAATDVSGRVDRSRLVMLGGAALLAMALGTAHWKLALASALILCMGSLTRSQSVLRVRLRDAVLLSSVVLLAASAVTMMYFRAPYDPFVNQANPASIDALLGVVGREQYDVPPQWPRRAPLWLQLGNLVQYADWQVAFGLDRWVGPSLRRTPFTLLFAMLAIAGAAWHRVRDRRSFRAFALALASASIGSVIVLNLRAGPSIGIGVLPADALHEARERDYFFSLAFAMAAAWGAMGATRFGLWLGHGTRMAVAVPASLLLAAVPIALNWPAADRSTATLAQRFATALLDSAPPNAVLLVAGDNDTYPLWYMQRVHGYRRDVTVVTIPLLPATWYRAELERRHGLFAGPAVESWRGLDATIQSVADNARGQARPLAVAFSVPAARREALGGAAWVARGLAYVRYTLDAWPGAAIPVIARRDSLTVAGADPRTGARPEGKRLLVDPLSMEPLKPIQVQGALDSTEAYITALLNCPSEILAAVRAGSGSVDPRCNLR
ncbi:MAG: protein O-mannosyl-transferase family [Gemmatimonadaceae bacterium]